MAPEGGGHLGGQARKSRKVRELEAEEARLKPKLDRVRFELLRERDVPELLATDQTPVEFVVYDTTKEKAIEGLFRADAGAAALARATERRGRRARFEFKDAELSDGLTDEGQALVRTLRRRFGRARVLGVYSERWARDKPTRHLQVVIRGERAMSWGKLILLMLLVGALCWCVRDRLLTL